MPKFRVRYARVVIMETIVEAPTEGEVQDEGLPGVYQGISDGPDEYVPQELLPAHVCEIQDQDFIWEVTPVNEDGDGLTGDAIDAP